MDKKVALESEWKNCMIDASMSWLAYERLAFGFGLGLELGQVWRFGCLESREFAQGSRFRTRAVTSSNATWPPAERVRPCDTHLHRRWLST